MFLSAHNETFLVVSQKRSFVFAANARTHGLLVQTLKATKVELNWKAFARWGKFKGNLTDQLKQKLADHPGRVYDNDNPWKFADGYFDKVEFRQRLEALKKDMHL